MNQLGHGHPHRRTVPDRGDAEPSRCAAVYHLCKHPGGSPEGKCTAVDAPAGAITCRDHHAFVSAADVATGSTRRSSGRHRRLRRKTVFNWCVRSSPTVPIPAAARRQAGRLIRPVVMNLKQRLVTPWIMNTNFKQRRQFARCSGPDRDCQPQWQYLMNPQPGRRRVPLPIGRVSR